MAMNMTDRDRLVYEPEPVPRLGAHQYRQATSLSIGAVERVSLS
jgi:hypothetical protein